MSTARKELTMSPEMKERTIAMIRLICPILTASAAVIGIEVDADTLYVIVMLSMAALTFIWAWWKNNNMTEAAQEAQAYLEVLKAEHDDRKDGDVPVVIDDNQ